MSEFPETIDHASNPMLVRHAYEDPDVLEQHAIQWTVDRIREDIPNIEWSNAIDEAIDRGMLYTDKNGALRVNRDWEEK